MTSPKITNDPASEYLSASGKSEIMSIKIIGGNNDIPNVLNVDVNPFKCTKYASKNTIITTYNVKKLYQLMSSIRLAI
jgi:hypothetical protein